MTKTPPILSAITLLAAASGCGTPLLPANTTTATDSSTSSDGDGDSGDGDGDSGDGDGDSGDGDGDVQIECRDFSVPEITRLQYVGPGSAENFGDNPLAVVAAWTWYADGWGAGYYRVLVNFEPALHEALHGREVVSLTMYTHNEGQGWSLHSDNQTFEDNNVECFAVTEAWDEMVVTANSIGGGQPDAYYDADAPLCDVPATSAVDEDVAFDLLDYGVLIAEGGGSHGLVLKHTSESPYRRLVFRSDDDPAMNLRPWARACWSSPPM